MEEQKPCTKCGELKLLAEFYCNRATRDGRTSQCRRCLYPVVGSRSNTTHSRTLLPNEVKRCTGCKQEKLASEFRKKASAICGRRSRCRACERPQARARYHRHGPAHRIRERYGLDQSVYHSMLAAQASGCCICGHVPGEAEKRLQVDHDHTTGRVRGLLCGRCNRALGLLGDTVEGLRRAVAYLEPSLPSSDLDGLPMEGQE